MILKPYPKYKDSGIDWIGQIPEGWEARKINHIFINRKEKNKMLQVDNILSVLKDVGVIRYEDKGDIGNKSSDNPSNYKIVYPNDIVLNSMNFYIGSVGISKELGVTSSVYIVLTLNQLYENLAQYFYFVFKNSLFQKYAGRLGKGIMEIREAIKYEDLKNEILPVPPLPEQTAITDLLDKKLAQIDVLIEKDKKLIELLKEKRTALINHAVTKGLDPNVKLKDSGIDWIGGNPEGWEVIKLKFNIYERKVKDTNKNQNTKFIGLENIESETGNLISFSTLEEIDGESIKFRENSVLFGKLRPYLAKVIKVDFRGSCTGELAVYEVGKKVNSQFLFYRLLSKSFIDLTNSATYGVKMPRVNSTQLNDIKIAWPSLSEQTAIANYLDRATARIDKAIQKVEQKINLLEEYKKSLIHNVVTGKIDVREVE